MGPLLRGVNFVADAVKSELPSRDIVITTLAYTYARKPPAITKPRDNVAIQVTASGCTYGVPLTDPRNAAFADDLRAWAKLTRRLYVWDYTVDAGNYLLPWPNYFVIVSRHASFFHSSQTPVISLLTGPKHRLLRRTRRPRGV